VCVCVCVGLWDCMGLCVYVCVRVVVLTQGLLSTIIIRTT
jgi:hypothetical protein